MYRQIKTQYENFISINDTGIKTTSSELQSLKNEHETIPLYENEFIKLKEFKKHHDSYEKIITILSEEEINKLNDPVINIDDLKKIVNYIHKYYENERRKKTAELNKFRNELFPSKEELTKLLFRLYKLNSSFFNSEDMDKIRNGESNTSNGFYVITKNFSTLSDTNTDLINKLFKLEFDDTTKTIKYKLEISRIDIRFLRDIFIVSSRDELYAKIYKTFTEKLDMPKSDTPKSDIYVLLVTLLLSSKPNFDIDTFTSGSFQRNGLSVETAYIDPAYNELFKKLEFDEQTKTITYTLPDIKTFDMEKVKMLIHRFKQTY
jgi:hypothetical protein